MDPIRNPYAPGAGTPPPELAGRDELLEKVRIAVARTKLCKPAKSVLMVGLRGVGKTVLLDRMRMEADSAGMHTMRIEAPEGRSLPALLAPQLRTVLIRLSHVDRAKDLTARARRALAGFASSLKLKYTDIEVGIDLAPEPGLADNGDLEQDLQTLLAAVGEAARSADTAVALFVDELQYVEESQLAALITALHRTAQQQLPIVLVGAGLPQLRGQLGNARSYAERMFDFPQVGPLALEHARSAIVEPARRERVEIESDALERIIENTQCYPYFLQEWGKHAWDVADRSPITRAHVDTASEQVIAALDESFYRVRFDRLTPSEKQYLRAMAHLGQGPHRTGDIAAELDKASPSLAPRRANLIAKGMVWSPSHGGTAFTVPMFDAFMQRIMPSDDWRDA